MGHCIINAIWRHQLFFCRNDISSGKKDLVSHSSSMFDHTVHKKRDSQQIINLFHISLFQFLTDKCTADLSATFHFFRNNIHSKAKLPSHSLQKLWCSLTFIPEPEIFSNCNMLCLKISHQDLFNKGFRFHMTDPVIQRTFDQHIHACFLKKLTSFLFCKDHLTADAKRKKDRLQTFFFLFQDLLNQFLVATVYAVKFSKCHRTL